MEVDSISKGRRAAVNFVSDDDEQKIYGGGTTTSGNLTVQKDTISTDILSLSHMELEWRLATSGKRRSQVYMANDDELSDALAGGVLEEPGWLPLTPSLQHREISCNDAKTREHVTKEQAPVLTTGNCYKRRKLFAKKELEFPFDFAIARDDDIKNVLLSSCIHFPLVTDAEGGSKSETTPLSSS
ncbi:unnamed protein product [Orchesella dallaii]|uniref:Uncharacterized protein n=1 Tax=Orchesella dallaii TaxID=48710 RepID=A0ABP1PTN6_9HEXA